MSARVAAVLARPARPGAAPPGVDPDRYAAALLEDVYDRLEELARVDVALAACPAGDVPRVAAVAWPTTRVLGVDDPGAELAVLDALAAAGAAEAVVVAADAPDVPGLVVGKLFSALSSAEAAACPAADGGLVALAARLPVATWLRAAGAGLDDADALERLRAAAPRRAALTVGPGWHRLRAPADVARLDPGLEGWAATRALLQGRRA